MAQATAEPLMDEREFLEALERFDPAAAVARVPRRERWHDHVDDAAALTNHLPVPVWAFDTANDEPDPSPQNGQLVWLVSGFLVGAATAVVIFRDRVASILTLLR